MSVAIEDLTNVRFTRPEAIGAAAAVPVADPHDLGAALHLESDGRLQPRRLLAQGL